MRQINLIDNNNNNVQVSLVRFFKYNNEQFLIYTLNEWDEKNYLKLYLIKVINQFGRCLSYHIADNEEWKKVQGILKTILKELKYDQTKTFTDLDYAPIIGMKIGKTRIFKFDSNLVNILLKKDNKNQQLNQKNQSVQLKNNDDDYKLRWQEAEKEIERLNDIMGDLLAENISYKNKYGEINN